MSSLTSRAALLASVLLAGLALSPTARADTGPATGVVAKTDWAAFKRGRIVDFKTRRKPGSIVIVTRAHALYYILGNGKAVKYRVATAKRGFEWSGTNRVSAKVKWPDWRPPRQMRKRRPDLPAYMAGGPENPLGARATIYRIHGTNEPASIGKSASSGCIRMHNGDVSELFRHVRLGATVIVV